MEDKDIFWENFIDYLKSILSYTAYNNWVNNVSINRLTDTSVSIMVPNNITKNYWEQNLAGYILEYSYRQYGKELEPTFIVVPKSAPIDQPTIPTNVDLDAYSTIDTPLNPNYTFDSFVIGEDNKMANGAALAVADAPGTAYNPFLIYGGVGLGKTHLMHAIGNEIKRKNPTAKIRYATSEEFMNDFVESLRNGSQMEFREMYRNIDVLLIDDIQFLSKKDRTQEEFFHTFNALYNNGKQIVLTCDRLPNKIANLEERLISRFKWGLSTDITPPDLETRIAILRKKASNEHLDFNSETLTYIANHIDTNIRELEGALVRVNAYAAIQGQEITVNLAAEALQSIIGKKDTSVITIHDIIQIVSKHFHVSVTDIKGKKRTKEIVYPRQIAMYLSRELTDVSFPKIAEEFGNRNHTTVIHAYEKVSDSLSNDTQLQEDVNYLKKQLAK